MTISLRRSRRAPKKGVSDFNVGDIVEVDRQHGIIARGRLAQLLTEGPSPNPRWLIKFDSQPYKDEEMYERAFGKLLVDSNAEETEEKEQQQSSTVMAPDLANSGSGSKVSTNPANSTATGNTIGKGGSASGEGEKSDDAKKGKRGSNSSVSSSAGATISKTTTNSTKEVQFQQSGGSGSNDLSDDSSSGGKGRYRSTADRASAREARSKRRQAQIDEQRVVGGTDILAGGKRRLPPPSGHSKKYKFNEPQYAEDGEVVKVKLLTGTLYLHRGQNRRVEFVRRV